MVWDLSQKPMFLPIPVAVLDGGHRTGLPNVARLIANGPAGRRATNAAQEHQPNAQCIGIRTDPPYYDNVPYADLSDFFYVWLRKMLAPLYPNLLGTVLVPKAEELVADPFRQGGKEASATHSLRQGMAKVFARMREN